MSTTSERDELLGIDRTAEIGAVVLHFGEPRTAEVLERLDEDAARYRRSQDHWVEAIAVEMSRNREVLARDFGVAFARKREELERDDPNIESLGPLRPVAPVAVEAQLVAGTELQPAAPEPAPEPEPHAPLPPRPALELPSYMQEQTKREVPVVTPVTTPPASPPAPAVRPALIAPVVASTEPVDLERLRNRLFRGPTPFAGTTTLARLSELREEAAADAAAEPAPGAEETAMYMPTAEERKQLATLPFKPLEPPSPDAPGPTAEPRSRAEAVSAPTEPLDLERLRNMLVRGPTPFAGTTTPERLAEIKDESESSAPTELVRPAGDTPGADETAMLVPSDPMRAAIAALPFASENPSAGALTVEGYAALAAQLQVHGATAEVLSKFHVASIEALRDVHAEQERQFVADPSRRAYFEKLRTHMARALRERRGSGG